MNIQIAVEDGLEVTTLTKHDRYEYAACRARLLDLAAPRPSPRW